MQAGAAVVQNPRQNKLEAYASSTSTDDELPQGESRQLAFELGHTTSHAEADFIVSAGNQLAFEHMLVYPAWPGALTLITGPAKSGKSHLARIWVARADALVAGVGDLEHLASVGGQRPVLIEDIDRAGYDETALFHLLNQSMRDSRALLMTARTPISRWPYTTDDVLSRARRAASFEVETPDDIQLSQMLVKLFDDRQIAVEPKVISYLLPRMERSTAEAVALVGLMDKLALTQGCAVNRTIAAKALSMRETAPQNELEDTGRHE